MYKIQSFDTKAGVSKSTGKGFTIYYAIATKEDTGNQYRINLGFKNTYQVGDTITNIVQNKYKEWVPASSGSTPATTNQGFSVKPEQAQSGGFTGRASNRPFPVPKDSGELSIIRQSALKAAIDTLHSYHEFCLDGEVASSTSLDDYTEQVLKVAYIFADFSSGHRELNALDTKFQTEGN